jgi:hypothetical protein
MIINPFAVTRPANDDDDDDDPESRPLVESSLGVGFKPINAKNTIEIDKAEVAEVIESRVQIKRRKRHDSPDLDVKRKQRHDSPDLDVPRRQRHDSPDLDVPRKPTQAAQRQRHDSPDLDVPRKPRHDSPDLDLPRKARHDSPDLDVPRRPAPSQRHDSPDLDVPRRRDHADALDPDLPRRDTVARQEQESARSTRVPVAVEVSVPKGLIKASDLKAQIAAKTVRSASCVWCCSTFVIYFAQSAISQCCHNVGQCP